MEKTTFLTFAIEAIFDRLVFKLLQDRLENVARDDGNKLVGDLVDFVCHQNEDEGGQDEVQGRVSLS